MSHIRCLEIIEEVFQGKRDAMSLLFTFAKQDPSGFVKAIDNPRPARVWTREAVSMISAGNKVGAIKLTRENRGLGLKEAKDVCDAAQTELQNFNPAGAEDLLLGLQPVPISWMEDTQKSKLGELLREKLKEADIP